LGVEPWTGQGSDEPADAYFQRRIPGLPCAALFVAARGRAVLLGVSEQLLGPSFLYRGSIGPLVLTFAQRETWQRIGMALADRFALQGLFGVDAIVDALGQVWPVEVNPRYTASVEVLERAFAIATIGWHVTACRDGRLPELPQPNASISCGKRIVLAPADVCISAEQSARWLASSEGWPCLADIPQGGTQVREGQPLLSLLAEGSDSAIVAEELARREQSLLAELRAYPETKAPSPPTPLPQGARGVCG
jgi:predicted ATP-grasp superfamily ATP-dependent carboligase